MKKLSLVWASALAAMMILAGVTPMVGIVTAAVPVPHNMWGHPLDEDGVQMPVGQLITSWIDGVEYGRNDTFMSLAQVWFDIDTAGNWVWAPGNPNSPWIREGGDLDDPIMYVWGDMTNIKTDPDGNADLDYGIFFESDLWLTTEVVRQDLNLSALVDQPTHFPKISEIIPEPTDGFNDYVFIYTEDPSFLMDQYYLQKNDGALNGPIELLTGVSNAAGYFYANFTNPAMDLNGCGDELKLVWANPGTAFGGRDIIVDRVEWNATIGGCHGPEPDNTIMTDASAPAAGFAIHRTGPVFADDTNDNAVDFVTDTPTPRPAITPPTGMWNIPAGNELWSGGMDHLVRITFSDNMAQNDQLLLWVNYSLQNGIPGTFTNVAITDEDPQPFPGRGDAVTPMEFNWSVPCENVTTAVLRAEILNPNQLVGQVDSLNFSIDCDFPTVLVNDPLDGAQGVPIDKVISITFSEWMNPASVTYTIEGGSATSRVVTWPFNDIMNIAHDDFDPNTTYWVNVTAGCDISMPGNCMAAVHSFSFVTYIVTPPNIVVDVPVGGERWTAGTPHDIEFTPTHEPGLAFVNIWLNYSCDTNSGAITSGSGIVLTSPYTWAVPAITIEDTNCVITADIQDTDDFIEVQALSGTFVIDGEAPTGGVTIPTMATDVPVDTVIEVTFDEAMKPGTVVFTLEETTSGTIVTGAEAWTVGDTVLTFTPDSLLLGATDYTVTVDMAAEDISLPGNTLAADIVFTFTTETTNTPPTIALATPTATTLWAGGGSGLITWTMEDAESEDANLTIDVSYIYNSVTTVITTGLAGVLNHTWTPVACPAGADTDAMGVQIFVEVEDEGGLKGNSTSAAFTIDCTDPTGTIAWTGEEKEGETLTFRIDGGSSDITSYSWNFGDTETGTGPTPTHSYDDGDTYTVTCTLTDAAGNTGTVTASIEIESIAEPGFLEQYWWIILIIIIVVIVAIIALAKRKKPEEEEEEAPAEEEEEYEEPEEEVYEEEEPAYEEEEVYEEEEPEIEEEAAPAEPEPAPAPVAAAPEEEAAPAEEAPAGETKECPSCGTVVPGDATECFLCGATL